MVGKSLGHYEIREPLGSGGMGDVYRAHDTSLNRDVAIKVLPEDLADDPDRLARLKREAHLLAALNHPNVATIFGFEESDGTRFLVMELVKGESLEQRLAGGALPVDEALGIFRQIAEALEAAHDEGIIHRDLKPANVVITPEGRAKVLDFGLAKTVERADADTGMSQSPTITIAGTEAGVILGTAPYMSPEQVRGKRLDKRADIWAFGCVLYETLTGSRAFNRETIADTLAAILEFDPDWDLLPNATPVSVRSLLQRCLQKNPKLRLRDIGDAWVEIETTLTGPIPAEAAQRREHSGWPSRVWATAAIAAAVVVGLLLGWLGSRPSTESATLHRLSLGGVTRLTFDPRFSEWPTWSPDGTQLAFSSNRDGDFDIYVRRVEGGNEVNITEDSEDSPADDFQPAYSPDGDQIAFISTRNSKTTTVKIGARFGFEFRTFGGDLWVVSSLGGQPRRLAQESNFPAWSPDRRRIAYVSGREDHRAIIEVDVDDGSLHRVLAEETSTWEIVRLQYSPNGAWMSFEALNPDRVMLMPATGGAPRELLSGISHVWDPSGDRLYYVTRSPSGGTAFESVKIDPRTGILQGSPEAIGVMTGIFRDLAISPDGSRFAVSELEGSLNLTQLPLTPDGAAPSGPEEELSNGRVLDRYPAYSPDGRRIALASDRLGKEEVWIIDIETKAFERLELPGNDLGASLPFWHPDGQLLAVTRLFPDGSSVWLAAVDGSHAEELQPPQTRLQGSPFSHDGGSLLYASNIDGVFQLFAFDLDSWQSQQLTTGAGDKGLGYWSPDDRWIVFNSNASGYRQVWRIPSSGGDVEQLTEGTDRIVHSFFSPDGRWVYFQPNHQNIYRMPFSGGEPQAVTTFPASGLFLEEPAISPDGRHIAYCRSNGGSTLWILTLQRSPR